MTNRSLLTGALLLAFVIVARKADAAAGQPPKLGLLFTTRNPDCSQKTLCRAEFNTYLVLVDGEKMRVAVNTPHLYVPRKDGFWEVGISLPAISQQKPGSGQQPAQGKTQSNKSEPVWQLWSAPIGTKPALPESPHNAEGEQTQGDSDDSDELHWIDLTWAGADYVSVTEQFGEYTTEPVIVPIDNIPRGEGETAWKPKISDTVVRRDLDACVDKTSDFNTHQFLDDADQSWSITRGKMRWEFVWTFSHSGRALRGYEASCPSSVYPPRQLVGIDSLGVGWNVVLSQVPDAQTAFASPDQSLTLVFTKTQVLALRREVNGLGAPFARVFLPVSEVLSAQWAIGKYADHWEQQLSHAESWTDTSRASEKR